MTRWLAGAYDPGARAGAAHLAGALAPYPATVLASDVAVDLHDAVGADIGVTGR